MIEKEFCIDLLKKTLEMKGQITLMVHGNSMLPTLLDNQAVIIQKTSNIKIGDIIAYYFFDASEVKIIIHRVVFVRRTYVFTKGDNNNFIDPIKISFNNILGVINCEN